MLITNILTVSGAILYLTFLSFLGGLVVLGLIVLLATLYYLSSKVSNRYFKEARNHSNLFINLLNGMMGGFKELSLHRGRRAAYISDISDSANMYREKMTTASVRMANTFIIGESFLITVLGVIAFGISRLFTGIDRSEIVSFVVIMLYLIGPINAILGSAPRLIELRVAWGRIRQLLKDIPASPGGEIAVAPVDIRVENFRVRDVEFHYMDEKGDNGFAIGPLSLEVKRGEAIFIVGGNGSGKTTLAKILTGLYKSDKGEILINGKAVESGRLGEYFSTVFTPPYLFEKLYDIDVSQRVREANFYSNKLKIATGIEYDKNRYVSIDLSGGQQKRLALLQCYLEDSPIYLFDELAADQEPGFRNYFYRVLIPEMKQAGKLVIAITHDDHYFDVADRVLRMENGQLEAYTPTKIFTI
jgi:cyclic peptide transporter